MADIKSVSYEELISYKEKIDQEIARRDLLRDTEDEFKQLSVRYLKAKGIQQGDVWAEPISIQDSYPEGWIVSFENNRWKSKINGNMETPGEGNWDLLDTKYNEIETAPKIDSIGTSTIREI